MRWTVAVIASVALAWWFPGDGGDAYLDWLTVRAVWDGNDPYAPVSQLAAHYGIGIGWDLPAPRMPGLLALLSPLSLVPVGWVPFVWRLIIIGALVWAWRIVRPYPLALLVVALPVAHVLWYANLSAVVTLLVAVAVARGSGVAVGVAAVMRAWPWFLGLAFLAVGRWRAAIWSAVTFVGLNTGGLLLPGVTFEGAVRVMVESIGHASIYGNLAVPLWVGVPVALLSLLAVWRFKSERMAVLGGLVLSPVVWLHYLTVLMVPIRKAPRLRRDEGLRGPWQGTERRLSAEPS